MVLVVWITETKLDFYRSEFLDYSRHNYIHNVSADMSSVLLQVFLVELGNLRRTSNHVLYLIHEVACCDSVNHNRIQVFLYYYSTAYRIEPATSRWFSLRSLGSQRLLTLCYVSCWTVQREFWGLINLMFLHRYVHELILRIVFLMTWI